MLPRLLFCLSCLLSLSLAGQFASPIGWEFSHRHVEGDVFELIATATADDGWSIYSQFTPEGGPVPTAFMWTAGDHYTKLGRTEETGHRKEGMDEMFGVNVIKFLSDESVVFRQRVRVVTYGTPIALEVEYMCCDDEQCLPPTIEEHRYELQPPGPERGEVPQPQTPKAKRDAIGDVGQRAINEGVVADETAETPATGRATAATQDSDVNPAPASAPATADLPQEEVLATYRATLAPPTEDDPVSWALRAEALNGERYRITLTGTMAPGWMVYSQDIDPDIGPVPTEVVIEGGAGITPIGEVTERSATLTTKYDKTWEAEVSKIDGGTVAYSQVVAVSADAERIAGFVYYQTCDDEKCLPPTEVPFTLELGEKAVATINGITGTPEAPAATGGATGATNVAGNVTFNTEPAGACSVGEAKTQGQGLWTIFGLGLLGGLFALIMPCIFPMIPLTVSFFTKSGGSRAEGVRRAGLYGFFIFLIYVLLSLPFHVLDGLDPGLLNNIASNVWLNILFFVVFMFFAGSFFGFYELTLPQSWSNRASRAEGTGGVAGIFFMALTLALVSFSCTGPILGSLLVEAVSGGAWPLTAGMAGFGVALGLPFALFAAFPGVLNNLPKSGGWLNSVKVVLGFVEVALAFKFLSNADLIGNWELLRIEPFLLVWMLCSLGVAAYLFGLISFPHDSKHRKAGPVATIVAVAGVLFTAYLAFGFTKDNDTGNYETLNLLSGIAPPVCYSYFNPCDCPLNITCFKDLDAGLAHAREVNKPVMIDFTGYTCVNCRKMEENVWSNDRIKNLLTDDYVLISLYVDDRKPLPKEQHQEVTRLDGTGRTTTIDQVGEKWHYFEQSVFAKATQPYYVLVTPDGQTLNPPVAYTPDIDTYENFLKCGLSTFAELQGK